MKCVYILFVRNQMTCDDDQECIVAFETEELLNTWLDYYCSDNNLNKDTLDCVIMLNEIIDSNTQL